MKIRVLILFFVLTLAFFVVSCGSMKDGYDGGYSESGGYGTSDIEGGLAGKTTPPDGGVDSGELPDDGNQNKYVPGQITSCALFDKDYFDFWKSLITQNQENNQSGLFFKYYSSASFKTLKHLKITLNDKAYGSIQLINKVDEQKPVVVSSAVTDRNGVANLFYDSDANYVRVNYTKDGNATSQEFEYHGEEELNLSLDNPQANVSNKIDVLFVVDTTGSMGDEIRYLKAEIENVIEQVQLDNEQAIIRLGLIFYRDTCDAQETYLMRTFDFTTDIEAQKRNLMQQGASGGGDYEEAVATALEEAVNMEWSDQYATKLIVHVADAPSHKSDYGKWNNAVQTAASKGIRIITVASSGVNHLCEYLFRSQSLITDGCYVYITNDSGIGNSHLEATVQERPVVEFLNKALIRLINGYHTGEFAEPVYYGGQN